MTDEETNQLDEEELMTGRRKTADEKRQDAQDQEESKTFRMQLLQSDEFPAFMEKWYKDHENDPYKYTQGKFEDAWIQHCKEVENGAAPMAHPKLTCGKWDSAKKTWVTDDTLIRSKQDDTKPHLTAGTFNRDTQEWQTEKPIEKDSESGLTVGKWDPEKKRWIR